MTDTLEKTPTTEPGKEKLAPTLGPRAALRYAWAQLTSMRTALILLFALAVAAVPGSLVPQRPVNPVRVSEFIQQHPQLGAIYDKLGVFNVYSSPWFSAIYLLLFVSLIGCIIPRVGVYARLLRNPPPRTPRNLSRLPAYASGSSTGSGDVLARATAELRRQHYRVTTHEASDGTRSVAAERGYLREAGNLVFHVSLLFLLLGVAVGGLFGFRGTTTVIVGQGFGNNLTQYDDFSAGGWFSPDQLKPFSIVVKNFAVQFETGAVQTGAARLFRLDTQVSNEPGETPYAKTIEVNHPAVIDSTTVHLIGHGYAPIVTVKDGQGNVAYAGPVIFLPQDGNFTSLGVIKAPDARPNRLAFQGIFAPTATVDGGGPRSLFPDAIDPAIFLSVWSGPPRAETGRPENVYSLDTTGLTQMKDAKGDILRIKLTPGTTFTLPNGQGSIEMTGVTRWVKLQVSDTPGVQISLVAIALAVSGLCLSLFIRPRRIWVRTRVDGTDESRTLIEVGGLDRADARAGLTDDVAELARTLQESR